MDPLLAATMLFGAIEMGLTAFVLGLLDRKDDSVLDRARDQVAETFLRGVVPEGAAVEATWTAKSPTKSKAQRRA
jgi:TetR/AcrR family fatty acid metabolism transcriptional regulator